MTTRIGELPAVQEKTVPLTIQVVRRWQWRAALRQDLRLRRTGFCRSALDSMPPDGRYTRRASR
jgi:hypothetical protein